MHRFYLSPEQCRGGTFFLSGSEAHHGLHVLRLRKGEKVSVLDGAGRDCLCTVANYDRDKVQLALEATRLVEPSPARITLLQAIPKGKIIESIIQKAAELGVARIVPLMTERAATRLDQREGIRKASKWQIISIEAIKQCGNAWLPQVEPPVSPAAFLARNEQFDLPLIASLQPESFHPRKYFDLFRAKHQHEPRSISIWIGPEGDFTPDEVQMIRSAGALPITLGLLVLRTETAAVYCLSVLNYELSALNPQP
jgi:16S rRNA (uracil1498-N3)-methyltransferase